MAVVLSRNCLGTPASLAARPDPDPPGPSVGIRTRAMRVGRPSAAAALADTAICNCPSTVCRNGVTFRSVRLLSKLLTRYWGYLALIIAIFGFFARSLGLTVVLILSLAALGYFLVQAPVWCCAVTRTGDLCRDNSHGLLLGCHRRQHKWQRLRQTFTPAGGRALLSAGKSAGGLIVLIRGLFAGVQSLIAIGAYLLR